MKYWAKPTAPREQCVLISETLDDLVASDHPIRLVDALVNELDWSLWEAKYDGRVGQPAIHPKLMAGAILYGLMKRIRTSRDLEEATRERVDFRWFLEGRTVDHSTFAAFRTAFEKELKDLGKQISRAVVQCSVGTCLVELILDGTRIRANSDRYGARTAQSLEKLVQACCQALQEKLDLLSQGDIQEKEMECLRERIEALQAERDKYAVALAEAQRRDEIKLRIDGANCRSVRVPVTDPESTILPNKEGGFAPNYTPTLAVEASSGVIVSADVVTGGDEESAVQKAVEGCQETLGVQPDRLLADGNFAGGESLAKLQAKGIEAYMPAGGDLRQSNPANRADPMQPIPPELWDRLPRRGKHLDSRAFVYEACSDAYYCPMGQSLRYERSGRRGRSGARYRTYFCRGRAGCPLAQQCIKGDACRRSLTRDQHQDVRDKVDARMASREGQAVYARRAPIVEGVFAHIKHVLGIRQFLLRGLRKVGIEWNWICAAFNLRKLLTLLAGGPGCASQALQSLPAGFCA